MRYSIYADDILIYSPAAPKLCLYDIVLSMEDNSAGTMSFCITSDHPAFYGLKKLATMIVVKQGDEILWKGRIISDDCDISHVKKIQCEGQLAFLNDSIYPEFAFSGSPETLFEDIIQKHNSQVHDRQKFIAGEVTVRDNNDYIVRSSDHASRTWKVLKEKCFQSSLGGHLRIRYEANGDHIDWLEDYTEVSSQSITFGKNIIDLLVGSSATETFTAIRPFGAVVEEQSDEESGDPETGIPAVHRIDIKSVNGGSDCLVNEEKAAEYGIIFADPDESIWEDVTLPENLLKKARARLEAGAALKQTIDVRAVDLNLTDAQMEALKVCTYVQVVSPLHGISEYYLLSRAEIHIDAPENTQYTLGAVKETLTDTGKMQSSVIKSLKGEIPSAVGQLKNDKGYVTEDKVIEVIKESSVSPDIEVAEESETVYRLKIISAGGEIVTPNLIGPQGPPGERGEPGEAGGGASGPVLLGFECDEQGNLWMYYNEGTLPPVFELDADGNLYYSITE